MSDASGFWRSLTREDIERIVEQVLEELAPEAPRAEKWRQWRRALEERLHRLEEMQRRGEPLPESTTDLEELRRYVAILREEEIIAQFVEDQIRFVLAKAMIRDQTAGEAEELRGEE